jgi:hypothetical protein
MVQQPGVPVLLGRAAERDPVRVAALEVGQQPVERLGVADLVLGQRRERHVLLQHRRDPGPLRVPEPQHELVVGHGQQQVGEGLAGAFVEPFRCLRGHPRSTSSAALARASASFCLISVE